MTAYYNENDPKAAAWLRELIKAGAIAPGEVDDRSILDIAPNELAGFTQCHFFAGIGVWSYALRLAGWPDDRPIWTGSCPCQPFSAAGKGAGFADERHLWPVWHYLIRQCRPAILFGEQVASKNADPWIDLVCADMEAMGYAFGAVPFPAAGVGAPHIRDRTYWTADSSSHRFEGIGLRLQPGTPRLSDAEDGRRGEAGRMADNAGSGRREERQDAGRDHARDRAQGVTAGLVSGRSDSGLGHASGERINTLLHGLEFRRVAQDCVETGRTSPTNGFWRAADWLYCRDGKLRPVEPGSFPLVNGAPARVGRLRGYGNAIVAEAAKTFIESVMDV